MEDKAHADISYINWFIKNDTLAGHKGVALNIIGWIYTEQGQEDKAIKGFICSLASKDEENAASRHILDMKIRIRV